MPNNIFSPELPPDNKQPIFWSGLAGAADCLAIAEAIKNHNRLFVIVTADIQTALRFEAQLEFFLDGAHPILHFPDWETLPYDVFSPLPQIISDRLKTLAVLPQTKSGALVVSTATLLLRLSPREHVLAHSFQLAVGDIFNIELNRLKLESVGYQCVSQVYQHGEFTVRGSIVDLFPMGSSHPYRIELFDDTIESIRTFDPDSQRSLATIDAIELFPAREFPFTDAAIKRFRRAFREEFPETSSKNTLYSDISRGLNVGGIEYYFPLFVEKTETLFDYLPDDTQFVTAHNISPTATDFFALVNTRFEQRKYAVDRPLLPPQRLFLSPAELQDKIGAFANVVLGSAKKTIAFGSKPLPQLAIDSRLKNAAGELLEFLRTFRGAVVFTAPTQGHREALIEKLQVYKVQLHKHANWQDVLASLDHENPAPSIVVAPLDDGFVLQNPALAIICERHLSGDKARQHRRQKATSRALANVFNDLNELAIGAPVVHQDYGVGRYLGLELMTISGVESEFLHLEYADGDKLYVPVASLHLIGRYSGVAPENVPLHKLGSNKWDKAKKKAQQQMHDVAAELLEINAKRTLKKGHAFATGDGQYQLFAAAFPFEETPDQQAAITAIEQDLYSPKSMDRIVCGDVGFGKTEVAMRAAFIAVQGGKQVAVLVPTTLLAQQHQQNFRDRFADWPIQIEVLSRFVSAKKQKVISKNLASGKVDIVIGTHKILSRDLQYADLGLVIIDEEHRFGVRQKEHFKKLRYQLDLLTMTATPIPRTLNMAMVGLRDISIIATPPPGRHPIATFIRQWQDSEVTEACQREIKRGGQVFFLHNDVSTMDKIARQLAQLLPEARIQIAHGQMQISKLEQVMLDFYHQRFNLLISSTIIESGIDIPSANTIIINNADKLGLAQMHQLRGRVGRSHHRAYCYCIVPPKYALKRDASMRLQAFADSAELGAGFMLSSHDLEIRGAGQLLGGGQSGQIQEIGFTLYTELLERTVRSLQSGEQVELDAPPNSGTEVDLQTQALIPQDYMPDVHGRLILYKRLSATCDAAELRELKIEMIDRFGLLPDALQALFSVTSLKHLGKACGAKKIEMHRAGGRIVFNPKANIDTEQLLNLVLTQSEHYQLDGENKLKFKQIFTSLDDKIAFLTSLLATITPTANA